MSKEETNPTQFDPTNPQQVLERWGLYRTGGRFTGIKPSTGAEPDAEDYDLRIATHVERFFLHDRAGFGDVAMFVHGKGGRAEDFPWKRPDETVQQALERNRWTFMSGMGFQWIPSNVYRRFRYAFDDWLKRHPAPARPKTIEAA